MRGAEIPDDVFSGSAGWSCHVSSWLNGQMLAASIPVNRGRVSASRGSSVPERLTLSVPERDNGVSWVPGEDPQHPLARYGQRLIASVLVTSPITGLTWQVRAGVYYVHEWKPQNGLVEVTAYGPLQRAQEARFLAPEAPRAGGTLASEFRRLMVPGVSVSIDPALVDRACPQGMQWETDRLSALYEIADAWPARMVTDSSGMVLLAPPVTDLTPVHSWTDGARGTLVEAQDEDTRDGAYNAIVATSSADTSTSDPVRWVAKQETGPMAWTEDGTGYGQVPRFWSSPLLQTEAQAREASVAMLEREVRPSRIVRVTCVPDPRVDLDDVAWVVKGAGADKREWLGLVHAWELPLTVGDGAMSVDVAVG